jgi:hypothetical protein
MARRGEGRQGQVEVKVEGGRRGEREEGRLKLSGDPSLPLA